MEQDVLRREVMANETRRWQVGRESAWDAGVTPDAREIERMRRLEEEAFGVARRKPYGLIETFEEAPVFKPVSERRRGALGPQRTEIAWGSRRADAARELAMSPRESSRALLGKPDRRVVDSALRDVMWKARQLEDAGMRIIESATDPNLLMAVHPSSGRRVPVNALWTQLGEIIPDPFGRGVSTLDMPDALMSLDTGKGRFAEAAAPFREAEIERHLALGLKGDAHEARIKAHSRDPSRLREIREGVELADEAGFRRMAAKGLRRAGSAALGAATGMGADFVMEVAGREDPSVTQHFRGWEDIFGVSPSRSEMPVYKLPRSRREAAEVAIRTGRPGLRPGFDKPPISEQEIQYLIREASERPNPTVSRPLYDPLEEEVLDISGGVPSGSRYLPKKAAPRTNVLK
jgi:hypothetical protein